MGKWFIAIAVSFASPVFADSISISQSVPVSGVMCSRQGNSLNIQLSAEPGKTLGSIKITLKDFDSVMRNADPETKDFRFKVGSESGSALLVNRQGVAYEVRPSILETSGCDIQVHREERGLRFTGMCHDMLLDPERSLPPMIPMSGSLKAKQPLKEVVLPTEHCLVQNVLP